MYARSDPIARSIAERLVALAWPAARAPQWLRSLLGAYYANQGAPVARGVDERELADALARSRALAFVVSLPRMVGPACANHFVSDDAIVNILGTGDNRVVTPLLDAREHLVHRSGLGRVVMAADGTLRFTSRMP
jgi:hypothetical protein